MISGNYISGTTGPGLYIHGVSLSVYPAGAAVSGYNNNVVIAANVIKGSVMSSGPVLSTGSNFAVQNVMINNNVLSGNYAQANTCILPTVLDDEDCATVVQSPYSISGY